MTAKAELVKTGFYDFDTTKIYNFKLTPCNEGHSMTYLETCKGNLENLFARCNEFVKGLKAIFPSGDFSVLIENSTFDNYVLFVPSVGILDKDGNLLLNLNNPKNNDIDRPSN